MAIRANGAENTAVGQGKNPPKQMPQSSTTSELKALRLPRKGAHSIEPYCA